MGETVAADRALRLVDVLWRAGGEHSSWSGPTNDSIDAFYLTFAQGRCAQVGSERSALAKKQVNLLLRYEAPFAEFYECASDAPMAGDLAQCRALFWADPEPFDWLMAVVYALVGLLILAALVRCFYRWWFYKEDRQ